jgi:hypothetical protein
MWFVLSSFHGMPSGEAMMVFVKDELCEVEPVGHELELFASSIHARGGG